MIKDSNQVHHTTLILMQNGYGPKSVSDLLESSLFSSLLNGELEQRLENMVYLTIFPKVGQENKFGKSKEDFIKKLSEVCDYLSVVYDSQTADYMKIISQSVYNLEREFRFLIELVFLRKYGVKWYEKYFQDSSKEFDRSDGRTEVIKYLKNPLDKRNFLDLKNFVEEDIKLSKNTMVEKLNTINELLVTYGPKTKGFESIYSDILELMKGIKELSEFKTSKVSGFDIYNHITPEISSEWEELYYSYRNLWAHNYCLMTQAELKQYQSLSEDVLTKIRTEITLLSLLEVDESISYPDESNGIISLSFDKIIRSGAPICRLILKIDTQGKRYILEVMEATYKDLFNVLEVLASKTDSEDFGKKIKLLEFNPFLTNTIKNVSEGILANVALHDKIRTHFSEVVECFKKKNNSFMFNELDRAHAEKKADLNHYLTKIHRKSTTLENDV
jgi:hypothetical protein